MNKVSKLIRDSKAAGFEVIEDAACTRIIAQRHKTRGTVLRGLVLYPNGTACDLTVRLDLARSLRNVATMRQILGLKS